LCGVGGEYVFVLGVCGLPVVVLGGTVITF
jgi:hypothetical protein